MTIQRFSGALFDLDGTLIDGYVAITASVNALLTEHGQPSLSVDIVKPYVGRGLEELLRALIPDSDPARDTIAYRRHYDRLMTRGTVLFPGAATLLNQLHASGCKLGICSNKLAAFTTRLLQHLQVAHLFSTVLGPEHVVHPKPAPEMLLLAAQRMDLVPKQILYVGDMSVDVEAGKAAGMTVWIVATGSEKIADLRNSAADRLFGSLKEIHAELFASDT